MIHDIRWHNTRYYEASYKQGSGLVEGIILMFSLGMTWLVWSFAFESGGMVCYMHSALLTWMAWLFIG